MSYNYQIPLAGVNNEALGGTLAGRYRFRQLLREQMRVPPRAFSFWELEMDYNKHYDKLIESARVRGKPEEYSERHHVVPRCLGGSDEHGNLVYLTAREHYVAHQLLVKIYKNNLDLKYAAFRMSNMYRYGSKIYSWVKTRYANSISGEFNPAKRPEIRKKISSNNSMKTESGRRAQKAAMSRPEVKAKFSERMTVSNPSMQSSVKLKRAEDLKKRIKEGSMNRGVSWTPELIAKRLETRRKNKLEANLKGEFYPLRSLIHHTQTEEGKKKHIEAVKRGWITRKNNSK